MTDGPTRLTPAEYLRRASERLREIAGAATPGRWGVWAMSVCASTDGTMNLETSLPVCDTQHESGLRTWNADYIATMSPPVALALADLLDVESAQVRGKAAGGVPSPQAYAVARAVIGSFE